MRLGLACCGDYSAGHFAAYRALADADVDVVVHLGDYVYAEVEGDLRPVDPDRAAVSREDYRARYAQVRRDPDPPGPAPPPMGPVRGQQGVPGGLAAIPSS